MYVKKKKKAGESAGQIYERGRAAHREFSRFSRWPLRAWYKYSNNILGFTDLNLQLSHIYFSNLSNINIPPYWSTKICPKIVITTKNNVVKRKTCHESQVACFPNAEVNSNMGYDRKIKLKFIK